MIEAINRHLAAGMHLTRNMHNQLIITDPDTGRFFALNGMTKSESDYLDDAKKHNDGRHIGLRKRFIHR
jgi:hypothetical protein